MITGIQWKVLLEGESLDFVTGLQNLDSTAMLTENQIFEVPKYRKCN
jgi:hypothetical protein